MEYYLITTYKCNLACDYCFEVNQKMKRNHKGLTEPQYSVDTLLNFLRKELAKKDNEIGCSGCNMRYNHANDNYINDSIMFYGGEPLLNQPFIKDVIKGVTADRELKNFKFNVQTNGTLLNTIDPYILKNLGYVFVSIDGDKEAHNRHRKFPDGTGSYDIIIDNVRWLAFQKLRGNFNGKVLARMTVAMDTPIYKSVTSLLNTSNKLLEIDMEKLRKTIGPKGNIKKALEEIVSFYKGA